jgi:hypothetical protein
MRGADIHVCGIETCLDALGIPIRSKHQASKFSSLKSIETILDAS